VKERALSFDFLRCWLAGHIPNARYTRIEGDTVISHCARCETLIVKSPRRRWVALRRARPGQD